MHDVLVVGAGPTGLFMAILLLERGFKVRIIDKELVPSDKSKAIAVQARTLEIFQSEKLADALIEKGLKLKAANAWSNTLHLAHIPFDDLDSDFPFILSLPQYETEKILTKHLEKLGVKVERGVELLALTQGERIVSAKLSSGDDLFSWVIGCDGAHSTTRKQLELNFDGNTFLSKFALADVLIKWDFPHDEFTLFLNKEGILAAIPLPEEQRYRIIFQSEPTLEEVKRLLSTYAHEKVQVSDARWLTSFTIHSRITEKYRVQRVFLAGDAAHIHSPAGGQGMNTGFVDAHNLAWKLDFVHKGRASEALLDTYEKERRDFGKNLLYVTERVSQIAMLKNPLLVFLRNTLFHFFAQKRKVQKKVKELISQIGLKYSLSIVVGSGGGLRAPNVETASGKLYELMRSHQGFILLHNQTPLCLPGVIEIKHDGKIFDPKMIVCIRPDLIIGCQVQNAKQIQDYFSSISQGNG